MDKLFLSGDNISRNTDKLVSSMRINPSSKGKCQLLVMKQMRYNYDKYKNKIPTDNKEIAAKYLQKIAQVSLKECESMIRNRYTKNKPKKTYSTSDINKYERDREIEVYGNRQLNINSRPDYTTPKLSGSQES